MIAIDSTTSSSPVLPVYGPRVLGVPPTTSLKPIARAPDDASGLLSASSLRARLAGPHADSQRLLETAHAVDIASEALSGAEALLLNARGSLGDPGGDVNPMLASIQSVTSGARAGGIAILQDGVTLNAGSSSLDLRPVSIHDLGAVIDMGRSFRLSDLRAGGALDARAHPQAAGRAVDAALSEVATVRTQLRDFEAAAIRPALRSGLSSFRAIANAGPVTEATADSIRRDMLGNAHGSRGTLTGSSPEGILRLLG